LADPISDEMSATGIASSKVRMNDGWSVVHAFVHESSVHTAGRLHWPLTPISRPDLKLVTTSTYAGISTTNRKISNSAYVTTRPTGDRRLTSDWRRGASPASPGTVAGGGVTVLVVVMSGAPPGCCR
jgi:hypothetical protein